jgi:hypothetical protein
VSDDPQTIWPFDGFIPMTPQERQEFEAWYALVRVEAARLRELDRIERERQERTRS